MKHFYVYYSYEEYGRGYIGSRVSKVPPEEDVTYFGSFSDKKFNPTEKIILEIFNTKEEALDAERKLHSFYDIRNNSHFANKSNLTTIYFSPPQEKHKFRITNVEFKNSFIESVNNNESIRKIAIELRMNLNGSTYDSIKRWIKKLNLDTSHFTGMGWNKGKKLGDRITEEQKEKSHYKYTYTVTTPTEEIIITKNLKKYCRDNNLNQRNMWLVSVGRVKTCKGYKITRELINNQKTNEI
jgi:hypothetical protein